jgi:hypothetical protein
VKDGVDPARTKEIKGGVAVTQVPDDVVHLAGDPLQLEPGGRGALAVD